MEDCDAAGDVSEYGFEELEKQDLLYGLWLRASPLPKTLNEQKKKESNSSSCSKILFNIPSRQNRCDTKSKEKEGEGEVEQNKDTGSGGKHVKDMKTKYCPSGNNILEIKAVT